LIDERVTVDAGSLGIALTDEQRRTVRDVIVTHPHMDHIASLPIFVDDLFGELENRSVSMPPGSNRSAEAGCF
jgi:glyoxylase-like metal-dependent hydrolase (beta-lactamase superfamily II)